MPLLMVDIDGVVSLFGAPGQLGGGAPAASATPTRASDRLGLEEGDGGSDGPARMSGSLHSIDGIPHFLSSTAAAHLLTLSGFFELVWASGWEEKANEYLPRLLGLPANMPFITFSASATSSTRPPPAHWKLAGIEAYAGERSLAWIDDAFNEACHAWARARPAPTLLVRTTPERGLTSREADELMLWAERQQEAEHRRG